MKPLSINRKSWLFKLARFGKERLSWNSETNTCEYLAAILAGIIKGIIIVVIMSLVGIFFFVTPIYGVYAGFQCGFFISEESMKACMGPAGGLAVGGMIMLGAWLAFGILFIIFSTWHIVSGKLRKVLNTQNKPSIIKELYTSWKDKICKKIEIQD